METLTQVNKFSQKGLLKGREKKLISETIQLYKCSELVVTYKKNK
jgi:hypothetical protein